MSAPAAATRYGVSRAELTELLDGQPRYRVDQVWKGLYERRVAPSEMTDLPAAMRDQLTELLPLALTHTTESVSDEGDVVKWLWECHDGSRIETVLMKYDNRATVCVSSQAGCAMACGFCATGQAGFERHLSVGEIVEQVMAAAERAGDDRVSNVVFMGMGEPLANYDATIGAVHRLHQDVGLSARHITVSTVGVVPGMRRLADEGIPVTLAVSLHAANDTLRDELVPLNRNYPIDDLVDACQHYRTATGRRVSFEWALIDGVNDRDQDAEELAQRAAAARAHVNLIPLNPTPGYLTTGSPPERVRAFAARLASLGTNATVRRNRGTTIDAACGQLRANQAVAAPTRRRRQPNPSISPTKTET